MPKTAKEEETYSFVEKGEWESVRNLKTEINRYQKIAQVRRGHRAQRYHL